jgi:hypothetical protein
MTPPDARARVEAWMGEWCPHDAGPPNWIARYKSTCPDCLLAFADEQGEAARQACQEEAFAEVDRWQQAHADAVRDRLAYGAVQRAEEREACARLAEGPGGYELINNDVLQQRIANAIRARREGPGGAQ